MKTAVLTLALLAAPQAMAQATPEGLNGFVTLDRLPIPEVATLVEGRVIWGDTCENCHGGNKLTGAPKITSTEAWAPRIAQGMDVLTAHAVEGFTGPRYTQMPARGGNADLTDDQVAAAVAFMIWASGGEALARAWANGQTKERENE